MVLITHTHKDNEKKERKKDSITYYVSKMVTSIYTFLFSSHNEVRGGYYYYFHLTGKQGLHKVIPNPATREMKSRPRSWHLQALRSQRAWAMFFLDAPRSPGSWHTDTVDAEQLFGERMDTVTCVRGLEPRGSLCWGVVLVVTALGSFLLHYLLN